MKRAPPPPRALILRDMNDDTTLTINHSNQGEPYRETIGLTFERGAHGSYATYEHLGSVELEGDEEQKLREFLNERHERRLKRRSNT